MRPLEEERQAEAHARGEAHAAEAVEAPNCRCLAEETHEALNCFLAEEACEARNCPKPRNRHCSACN